MSLGEKHFRTAVEKIFNHWTALKLAVEHGMGGRNGHQTAIEIMDYVYKYCISNENITQGELQNLIEDLMDQEFSTICDDGSISEICLNLLKYLQMCTQGKYAEVESDMQKFPVGKDWLRNDIKVTLLNQDDNSSSDEDTDSSADCSMDVDSPDCPVKNDHFVEPEPGWTTVRLRRKH